MRIGIFLVSIFFVTQSFADLLIEPYLSFDAGAGTSTHATNTNLNNSATSTGTNIGARIGYKLPLLVWFAADYSMYSGSEKLDYLVANDETNTTERTSLFLDVGVDLPILFRFWAGYGISNKQTIKNSTIGLGTYDISGSAYKFGAAFTGLPFVNIYLEYTIFNYNDYGGSQSGSISTSYSKFDRNAINLGVSLPLNL